MRYRTLLFWNLIGNIVWGFTFVTGGYLIGILPVVMGNINLVLYTLLIISRVALAWVIFQEVSQFRDMEKK
jgi:membrane-associated protein